jgi:amidophosphoribosyltransferase
MADFCTSLHEECGVFGIYDKAGTEDVAAACYSALYALQHRGQESCGIAVNVDGVITGHRDLGLVNEVFTPAVMASLPAGGKMATGHVRYATSGSRTRANAQPMVVRHCKGTIALCHNGNLTNAAVLRHELEMQGAIFHGSSDTEVICYLVTRARLRCASIEAAISETMDLLAGAYSLVIMSPAKLIAARDPHGFRPLCIGTLPGGGYVFASESCALDAAGAEFLRDVAPGEIVIADHNGLRSMKDHCNTAPHTMCVFEYIYFARPDSQLEGFSVHEARKQAGRFLAPRSIPSRRTSSSACRIPASTRRSAMPRPAASPTASALSKTNISAAPSSRAARSSAKTACASSSTRSKHGRGQARRAHRRFDRPRHHLRAHHQAAARRGREGSAFPRFRAAVQVSLLFRHRHPRSEAAGGHGPHGGADQRRARRGQPGISVRRARDAAGPGRKMRLLHRVLYGGRYPVARPRPSSPTSMSGR